MRRSTERILTTHTGSLPRPPDLLEMIQAREKAKAVEAGRELPTDWRPPLQNDLDELKALLRKMSLMVKAG